ncbi:MAG: hypothetical protein ACKVOY_03135 [Burkholderiaceae bacterium]
MSLDTLDQLLDQSLKGLQDANIIKYMTQLAQIIPGIYEALEASENQARICMNLKYSFKLPLKNSNLNQEIQDQFLTKPSIYRKLAL